MSFLKSTSSLAEKLLILAVAMVEMQTGLCQMHFPRLAMTLQVGFQQATLPSLDAVQKQFDNILCETVIMHLPKAQIPDAIGSLKRILNRHGILYFSWRVTKKEDLRHADGRLYSAFDPQLIIDQFSKNSILHFEDQISASSGKRVCRLIYRKE